MANCLDRKNVKLGVVGKVPSPLPRKIEIESSPSLTTAKSCFPSPLKSPVAIAVGLNPTGIATGFWNVPSQLLRSTSTAFARGSLGRGSWPPLVVHVSEVIAGWFVGGAVRRVPHE